MRIPNLKRAWRGEHDGVQFEVQNFTPYPGRDAWTFYLFICLDRIPEKSQPETYWLPPQKDEKGRIHYDYYAHSILNSIEWHRGITWYSKKHGFDGEKRVVKVGCDFRHYWDEGQSFCIETVLYEAIEAVKSFRRLVPGYKYWCHWNGSLHSPSEVIVSGDGTFKCVENCSGRQAYKKRWPDKEPA